MTLIADIDNWEPRLIGKSSAVRFALAGHNRREYVSDRWTIFTKGKDVYIASPGTGAATKISLHKSGICRYALTENLWSHSPPKKSTDRVISKWKRGEHRDVLHTHILSIHYLLHTDWVPVEINYSKKLICLSAPPNGGTREIAFFLSETNPIEWENGYWLRKNILGVFKLDENSYLAVRTRVSPIPLNRIVELKSRISTAQGMVVGSENPKIVDTGHYMCTLSESTESFGQIYIFCGVPVFSPDHQIGWHTKTGHLRKQ